MKPTEETIASDRTRSFGAVFLLIFLNICLTAPLQAREALQEIVVKPGDTLWSLSQTYLKDPRRWNEILKHNKLPTSDPTIALPGTKIKIPLLLIKEKYRNAKLVGLIPEVRLKKKNGDTWKKARENMIIAYEDSLRTMKGAQARVQFPTHEIVQINENSYVVLKPEKILQEIQLLKGGVRASRAKVIMPQGTVVKPRGLNSDYNAKVREDSTEVVYVYKGKVDVTAQGKTVTVREGFGTEVPQFSPPKKPVPLPQIKDFDPAEMTTAAPRVRRLKRKPGVVTVSPELKSPRARDPRKSRGGAKSVVDKNILAEYRLQLAKDKTFHEILLEKTEKTGTPFNIKEQPLPDGPYYMRVAFIDALGVMGIYSAPSPITKDAVPPTIDNLFPQDGQTFTNPYCDVGGTVEGASMVAINEEVVFISPTGHFSRMITLKDGDNKITVIARDIHGNETTITRNVSYKNRKKG